METTFSPRAQRAFCAAEILARAAALIVRRPRVAPVLFNPLRALIAVSRAFTCCAALSRSAFNCAIMSMCSSPGEDCTGESGKRALVVSFFPRLTSHHLPVTLSKSLRYRNAQPTPYSVWPRIAVRSLTWVSDKHLSGWACSACDWTFPLPSLLSDPEAKKAYDRLASAKFQRHDCATQPQPVASLDPDTFIARAKGLVMRGFKPKDAAEIVSREIMFENHDDPDIARKVQIEALDFLRRVKEGLT